MRTECRFIIITIGEMITPEGRTFSWTVRDQSGSLFHRENRPVPTGKERSVLEQFAGIVARHVNNAGGHVRVHNGIPLDTAIDPRVEYLNARLMSLFFRGILKHIKPRLPTRKKRGSIITLAEKTNQ